MVLDVPRVFCADAALRAICGTLIPTMLSMPVFSHNSYTGELGGRGTKLQDFYCWWNDTTSKGKIHLLRKTQVDSKWYEFAMIYFCRLPQTGTDIVRLSLFTGMY